MAEIIESLDGTVWVGFHPSELRATYTALHMAMNPSAATAHLGLFYANAASIPDARIWEFVREVIKRIESLSQHNARPDGSVTTLEMLASGLCPVCYQPYDDGNHAH